MTLLSIAPMIDWTNTHFRVLMRILAPEVLLYTEMLTTGAILNKPKRALFYDKREDPLVLQLGGSEPKALADCAKMAEEAGFAEINLNLGCPSDRVQAGRFGACLMREPLLVSECISEIKNKVSIPVTVKTRIGIDHEDSYAFFSSFVKTMVSAGMDKLVVHARKAWLKGLSPKQNRTIPPINYDRVYQIKKELACPVIINGNIDNLTAIQRHLEKVDGVMLGRLATNNPYAIATIHHALYPLIEKPSQLSILQTYIDYIKKQQEQGHPLSILLKPLQNFAYGLPFARIWKRSLSLAQKKGCLSLIELACWSECC